MRNKKAAIKHLLWPIADGSLEAKLDPVRRHSKSNLELIAILGHETEPAKIEPFAGCVRSGRHE